jgi:phosphoribosylaminoimidazole (AIR) synthetase
MGVGMALIVRKDTVDRAVAALASEGCEAYVIGEIVAGDDKVILY